MKLRIHGDSLRLRLNRSDVEQFRASGLCAASLRFDSSSQLTYMLETSSQLTAMEVRYLQDCIRVLLPFDLAQEWAGSDRISLSLNRICMRGSLTAFTRWRSTKALPAWSWLCGSGSRRKSGRARSRVKDRRCVPC